MINYKIQENFFSHALFFTFFSYTKENNGITQISHTHTHTYLKYFLPQHIFVNYIFLNFTTNSLIILEEFKLFYVKR